MLVYRVRGGRGRGHPQPPAPPQPPPQPQPQALPHGDQAHATQPDETHARPAKKAMLSWGKGRDTEHAYTPILLKHLEMKKKSKLAKTKHLL